MHSKIVGNIGYICESGSKGLISTCASKAPTEVACDDTGEEGERI
jgi:hypothetical protein